MPCHFTVLPQPLSFQPPPSHLLPIPFSLCVSLSNLLSLRLCSVPFLLCRYLSYLAPSSRWDIAMECEPEPDSDDEEEAAAAAAEAEA